MIAKSAPSSTTSARSAKSRQKRNVRRRSQRDKKAKKAEIAANNVKPASKAAPAVVAAPVLSGAQRKKLRAAAHALSPLVQVGHGGITGAVLTAAAQALLDHELIKVRLHEPEDKHAMAQELADGTKAALCGLVGHTVILYKPNPEHPRALI